MKLFFRYACIGIAAGVVNGLLGAGGGTILVPLLLYWGHLEERNVFATALCIMLPLSAVSLLVRLQAGGVSIEQAIPYLVGGVAGGLLGGLAAKRISFRFLHLIFGLLILWGGVRLLWQS